MRTLTEVRLNSRLVTAGSELSAINGCTTRLGKTEALVVISSADLPALRRHQDEPLTLDVELPRLAKIPRRCIHCWVRVSAISPAGEDSAEVLLSIHRMCFSPLQERGATVVAGAGVRGGGWLQ